MGEESTEEPGGQDGSDEWADPKDVKVIPCVVPIVQRVSPTEGLRGIIVNTIVSDEPE